MFKLKIFHIIIYSPFENIFPPHLKPYYLYRWNSVLNNLSAMQQNKQSCKFWNMKLTRGPLSTSHKFTGGLWNKLPSTPNRYMIRYIKQEFNIKWNETVCIAITMRCKNIQHSCFLSKYAHVHQKMLPACSKQLQYLKRNNHSESVVPVITKYDTSSYNLENCVNI
jgi:hypothetical protein